MPNSPVSEEVLDAQRPVGKRKEKNKKLEKTKNSTGKCFVRGAVGVAMSDCCLPFPMSQ
jgi:hypothetical protein